jgi:DNA modification methylase
MKLTWNIIHGDCLNELAKIEPGTVRLAFADPPYNIGVDYGEEYDDKIPQEKFLDWSYLWISAVTESLTSDGSLWLLINHEWACSLEFALIEHGFKIRDWITWYETFGVNCNGKFNRCSRRLLHAVKHPKRFVFHGDAPEIRRPSDRQSKYNDKRANPDGKLWDDVWTIPRLAGTHAERLDGFPTQLPLALLRPIVACASDPGDLVLDPFSGSATTGAVCLELGRRYIGIERSAEFCRLSRERLETMEAVTK